LKLAGLSVRVSYAFNGQQMISFLMWGVLGVLFGAWIYSGISLSLIWFIKNDTQAQAGKFFGSYQVSLFFFLIDLQAHTRFFGYFFLGYLVLVFMAHNGGNF
jgi:hypothetical protein